MMKVVSNTSPIINLAAINHLDVLRQVFGTILIPQAVYHEIVVVGSGQPGADEVQGANWIQVHAITNQPLITVLTLSLDQGEAEAIALAVETQADLVLLDERMGRSVASHFGLKCIGLLGILIEAKRTGVLPAVKPVLDDLRSKAGFWVSPALYHQVLQTVDE